MISRISLFLCTLSFCSLGGLAQAEELPDLILRGGESLTVTTPLDLDLLSIKNDAAFKSKAKLNTDRILMARDSVLVPLRPRNVPSSNFRSFFISATPSYNPFFPDFQLVDWDFPDLSIGSGGGTGGTFVIGGGTGSSTIDFGGAISIGNVSGSISTIGGGGGLGLILETIGGGGGSAVSVNSGATLVLGATTLTLNSANTYSGTTAIGGSGTLQKTAAKFAIKKGEAIAVFDAPVTAQNLSIGEAAKVVINSSFKSSEVALYDGELNLNGKLRADVMSLDSNAHAGIRGKLVTETLAIASSSLNISGRARADIAAFGYSSNVKITETGVLRVNDVLKLQDGTFSFGGKVVGDVTFNGGELSPLTPGGTVKIDGDFRITPSHFSNRDYNSRANFGEFVFVDFLNFNDEPVSEVQLDLDSPRAHGKIRVSGKAKLQDVLMLSVGENVESGDRFKVLTATGGIKGRFRVVADDNDKLRFKQIKVGNSLYVQAVKAPVPTFYFTDTGTAELTLLNANTRITQLENQLLGIASGTTAVLPPFEANPDSRWAFFAEGAGAFGINGLNYNTAGGLAGAGCRINNALLAGFYSGYYTTDNFGFEFSNTTTFGLFGTARLTRQLYLYGAVGSAFDQYEPGNDGMEFNTLFGGGAEWKTGPLVWGPFASLQYTNFSADDRVSETSFGTRTVAEIPESNSLATTVGLNVAVPFKIFGKIDVTPSIRAAWQNEALDYPASYFLGSAGLSLALNDSISASFFYTTRAGSDGLVEAFQLGVGYLW